MTNSRYLMYEAQQAHHFGLPAHLAVASVTSVPAAAAGLDHRIGVLRVGVDADAVLWDSHPLRLGATPVQVWIDGLPQLNWQATGTVDNDEVVRIHVPAAKRGPEWGRVPDVPNWDAERVKTIEWEGLVPFERRMESGRVVFRNVSEVWVRGTDGGIEEVFSAGQEEEEAKRSRVWWWLSGGRSCAWERRRPVCPTVEEKVR